MSNYYPPLPYYGYPPPPPLPKKKKRLRKFIIWAAMITVALFVLGAIFSDEEIFSGGNESLIGQLHKEGETWAVYWYLCGSDLETDGGFASGDLAELYRVTLPDNVQVVVETGGSYEWEDPRVDPDRQCRFLYSGNTLRLIERQPAANMSDGRTLTDFLAFCHENYPADHEALVLWDHGGGSVGGVISDERYDTDCISLRDLRRALESVYKPNEKNPPLDMVGFDACLMATVETAGALKDIARWMVASEELEPGCGWNYTGFFQALADEPRLNGAMLGRAICDSYAAGCNAVGAAGDITLSCVDLSRIEPLLAAWHNVGVEALAAACDDPNFLSAYGRSAGAAKQYGPNEWSRGYTGMLDMGDLVRGAADVLPETYGGIEAALRGCVVYKINGPYRMNNAGLAAYYPLGFDEDDLAKYVAVSISQAHDYLYEYLVYGQLSQEGARYARSMEYIKAPKLSVPETPVVDIRDDELPQAPSIENLNLENYPVVLDGDNNATLDLGGEIADQLTGVYFELAYYDQEDDFILLLGRDNDLNTDWETGVFKDNFWGTWGAIDGYIVYMELTYESGEYDLYDVPILLNGEECSLRVSYVWETESFEILGARRGLDDNGLAGKELIQLQPGDEITTLHYIIDLSEDGDDGITQLEIDTFIVSENTSFAYEDLWDGEFLFFFDMVDARGGSAYSEMVSFTMEGGEIYVEVE